MPYIPLDLLQNVLKDPFYKKCARASEGGCSGRITFEEVILFSGRQIKSGWNVLPLCCRHHSVLQFQDAGLLDKEKNQWIALNRASEAELKAISKVKNWLKVREILNKKFGNLNN